MQLTDWSKGYINLCQSPNPSGCRPPSLGARQPKQIASEPKLRNPATASIGQRAEEGLLNGPAAQPGFSQQGLTFKNFKYSGAKSFHARQIVACRTLGWDLHT